MRRRWEKNSSSILAAKMFRPPFLVFSRVFSSSSQRILVQRSATLRRDRFDFAPMLDAVGAALSFVVFLCFKGSSQGRALFCHPLRFLQLCLSLRQYTSDLR